MKSSSNSSTVYYEAHMQLWHMLFWPGVVQPDSSSIDVDGRSVISSQKISSQYLYAYRAP